MVITDICFNGTLTMCINFKAAYDKVPHEWVTSVLDTVCVFEIATSNLFIREVRSKESHITPSSALPFFLFHMR